MRVIIILGSPADMPWAQRILDALSLFGVESEVHVASAHKTPEYLLGLLRRCEEQGDARVYITVAGRSNALSGFVDAQVVAPVIACPPSSDAFGGMDILSSLRMPRGVAPLVVLEPENAALAAVKILGLASSAAGRAPIKDGQDPRLQEMVVASQEAERQRVLAGQPGSTGQLGSSGRGAG